MPRDTTRQTFLVAGALCVVCSVLVSSAAVGLRPLQTVNKERDRMKNILAAGGLHEKGRSLEEIFEERIETKLVDLETGTYVTQEDVPFDIDEYDQVEASKKPDLSVKIPSREDTAGIGRREKYSFVYLVKGPDGSLEQIILPVYGKGLWSTLYGFLAVAADTRTVKGLTFYAHAETPGLGGEVDNPKWKAQWPGKKLYDEDWDVKVRVLKGTVNTDDPEAEYRVDGLSGATITTNGVTGLLRYWVGEDGFKPFLENIRSGELQS